MRIFLLFVSLYIAMFCSCHKKSTDSNEKINIDGIYIDNKTFEAWKISTENNKTLMEYFSSRNYANVIYEVYGVEKIEYNNTFYTFGDIYLTLGSTDRSHPNMLQCIISSVNGEIYLDVDPLGGSIRHVHKDRKFKKQERQLYSKDEHILFSKEAIFVQGLYYMGNNCFYIVKPNYPKFEIARIYVDHFFKITDMEIGEIKIIDNILYICLKDETINYTDEFYNYGEKISIRAGKYIDMYGEYLHTQGIEFPKINDILAKRIYIESGIEIIRRGDTREYFELLDKLKNSRLVIFNNRTESNKYIYSDMERVDYAVRYGENDETAIDLYNEHEAILHMLSTSNRAMYPGIYKIQINYKVNE